MSIDATAVIDPPAVSTHLAGDRNPGDRDPGDRDPRDRGGTLGLARLRIIVLGVGFTVVGAAAGRIFDVFQWTLLLAPIGPTLAAVVLASRRFAVRLAGATVAVLCSVVLAVWVAGGALTDAVDAVTAGLQRLLSTDWPSPVRPDLLGAVAGFLALATATGTELATRRRWHLLPLAPLLVSYVVVLAASAPIGAQLAWLLALAVVATCFATLRNDGNLRDRLMLLRGERRLLPLLLLAIAVAAAVSLPVSLASRADPRRNDPARQTASLLDPIEASLALRSLDPAIDLHVIEASSGPVPTTWRTAALVNYDGQRWSPSLTIRPIGRTLGPATANPVSAEISFLDANLTFVPLTGSPVSVEGAAVETDAARTVVRLVARPQPGDVISVVTNRAPALADAAEQGLASREVDDGVSGLTGFARSLGGDGTALQQAQRIETTMRNDFLLDSNAPGGGLQRTLIERFLRDTRRGNAQQFATGFVLLVRSLGIDARVATGFLPTDEAVSGRLVLDSSAAAVWPEIRLVDGGWLAFDPVPSEEASEVAPPPPQPRVQTPAAPQPPVAPPPDPSNETPPVDDADTPSTAGPLSTALTWIGRGALVLAVLLLPLLLIAGVILAAKSRRRRRRLGASTPADRIRGAWALATDALVDAGLSIGRSATDREIARDGQPLALAAGRELHRLALLSSAATFGSPARPDLLVDDATACLSQLESTMAAERRGVERIRWRLSLRSLRASTRSPVTG
jgi:transglutaminase-like putative cysteine protease